MRTSATLLNNSRWDFLPTSDTSITPMRIGIIGCGPRAWYNGIPKLRQYAEYDLVSLCDIRPNLVERVGQAVTHEYDVTLNTYTDYRDMIQKEKLDAVLILIDADKQAAVICDCLESDLHVMAEVPMCYTMEDCWRIVTTVERTGKQFLLMEQLRYGGYVQAWREIVASGVLGPIAWAEGEYFHNLPLRMHQDSNGIYYNAQAEKKSLDIQPTWRALQPQIVYLPHDLSPILYALDDRVVRVTAMQSSVPTETAGKQYPAMQAALMHTAKDTVMRMAVTFSTASPERHWQHIKGTRGYVELPRTADGPYLLWVDGWQMPKAIEMPWGLQRVDAPEAAVGSGHGDCDYYVFAAFADAVLRDQPLTFDVYKAVEITAPALAAAESLARHGEPVDVPDFRPGPNRTHAALPELQTQTETATQTTNLSAV